MLACATLLACLQHPPLPPGQPDTDTHTPAQPLRPPSAMRFNFSHFTGRLSGPTPLEIPSVCTPGWRSAWCRLEAIRVCQALVVLAGAECVPGREVVMSGPSKKKTRLERTHFFSLPFYISRCVKPELMVFKLLIEHLMGFWNNI